YRQFFVQFNLDVLARHQLSSLGNAVTQRFAVCGVGLLAGNFERFFESGCSCCACVQATSILVSPTLFGTHLIELLTYPLAALTFDDPAETLGLLALLVALFLRPLQASFGVVCQQLDFVGLMLCELGMYTLKRIG